MKFFDIVIPGFASFLLAAQLGIMAADGEWVVVGFCSIPCLAMSFLTAMVIQEEIDKLCR